MSSFYIEVSSYFCFINSKIILIIKNTQNQLKSIFWKLIYSLTFKFSVFNQEKKFRVFSFCINLLKKIFGVSWSNCIMIIYILLFKDNFNVFKIIKSKKLNNLQSKVLCTALKILKNFYNSYFYYFIKYKII